MSYDEQIKELGRYDNLTTELSRNTDAKYQNHLISKYLSRENQIITTYDNEQILVYKQGYYQQQAETLIKEQIQEILTCEATNHRVKEIINQVKRMTYKDRQIFETTPLHLINVKNGLFNINTKKLEPHSPNYYFLSQIQTNYNKEAWISSNTLNFFKQIVVAKDMILLGELITYTLYRSNPFKKAFMLNGGGNNGKTTFLKIIMGLLGQENYSTVELQDLDDNRFSKIELYGKHANLVDDLPNRALKQTGAFKQITGNGEISGEEKYGGRFKFKPYAKMCFATNNVPRTNDDSDAFYDRWIILNFPNSFTGTNADTKLDEKLTTSNELEGLLSYCLSLLPLLLKRGFSDVETTDEKRLKYNRLSDPVGCFLVDSIEKDTSFATPKQDLYETFRGYCVEHNYPFITEKTFSRALYTIYPRIEEGRLNTPISSDRKRCWIGVKYIGKVSISFEFS